METPTTERFALQRYGALVGRVLLALIFVISGFAKIGSFAGVAGYMASKGIPLASFALVIVIAVETGAGLMLMAGWWARTAALGLFLFTVPATLLFHDFWAVDAAQYQDQFNHFMKNVCILGGMLYVMVYGAGPLSIDYRSR